jgi:hypothetical protein
VDGKRNVLLLACVPVTVMLSSSLGPGDGAFLYLFGVQLSFDDLLRDGLLLYCSK